MVQLAAWYIPIRNDVVSHFNSNMVQLAAVLFATKISYFSIAYKFFYRIFNRYRLSIVSNIMCPGDRQPVINL